MNLVPKKLQKNEREIKRIHEEIKEDYAFAVKKSVVDFVLKEPEIDEDERFLDEDDETPMTIELAAVSEAWKKLFKTSKRYLTHNLHLINQCMLQTQTLWHKSFVDLRLIDVAKLKSKPKIEMLQFQDLIYQEIEKGKKVLKEDWSPQIVQIFRACQKSKRKKILPPDTRLPAFLTCLATLMSAQLQQLAITSISDFREYANVLESDSKGSHRPGFILNLKVSANKISFTPSFADIEASIVEVYTMIKNAVHDIQRLDYTLLEEEASGKPKNLKPVLLPEIIDVAKDEVRKIVAEQNKVPTEYIKMFETYMHLIDGTSEKSTDSYVNENHTFDEFKEKVLYFDNLGKTINNDIEKVVQLGMYELHCDDLILNLFRKTDGLREKVLQKMSQDHQNINNNLCERYEEISNVALTSPNNTGELVELRAKVSHIETVVMTEMAAELNKAAGRLVFLSDFCQFTTSEMKLNTKTFQWHAKMPSIFEEHRNIMLGKTNEYQKALKLKRDRFQEELDGYSSQVEEFFTYGSVDELPKYLKKAQALKTKLEVAEDKIKHFNMEEKAFEWEQTSYPTLAETQDKLAPFVRLYEISMDFMDKQKTWFESPMGTHHPDDINKQVEDSLKTVIKLEKDFSEIPAAKTLVVDVRQKIEDFKDKMPIIKTLGNPALRERHWETVSNTVGFPVKGGSETNLYKILDMGLDEYVKKFEKISETATKEHNLELSMEHMVEEWSDKEFKINPYGETNTYTLSATDDIQSLLDDHIVKTQTMRGSPYIKPFEERIGKWEEQLLMLQEIMDEWLKVQGTWLYFEPIFSSPDIMSQMPEEGRRFTTVDKNWRDIMKAAIVDKHVLAVLDIDRILEKLKKSNELLDLINKGLYDYLEKKRLFFPRFFFLSNAQLLEILSETKDPSRVARYLVKIFEGVNSLEFNDELEVTKIKSISGEVIPLAKNVSTAKARGQVDRWLADLDKQIKESLQKEIKTALTDFIDEDISQWIHKLPSQIVICVLQTLWTSFIHKAIPEGSNALSELKAKNLKEKEMAVSLLSTTEDSEKLKTLGNVIITNNHIDNIIKELLENNVSTHFDFFWKSQLKFYWEETEKGENLMIKMIDGILQYGYEYFGSYERLVMTPLTEKCFRVLTLALHQIKGGSIQGPTGTGKTETVKDLSKACGKQCIVFNCSEGLGYRPLGKFIKGLACSGAWSCFDEFHRINTDVLSIIAQEILTLQRGIQANQTNIVFDDTEILLNPTCALFVTMEALSSVDKQMPDNFQVLFRNISMNEPDPKMIIEAFLASKGFVKSLNLARKLTTMFHICQKMLSKQPHYEFGLRSIKAVINLCVVFRSKQKDNTEEHIVFNAVYRMKFAELLPDDQALFMKIASDIFPGVEVDKPEYKTVNEATAEVCKKENLQCTEYFLSKIQEMYEMISLNDGIMIVGEAFSGKTTLYKVLAQVLKIIKSTNEKEESSVHKIVVNPKSLTIEQMYGFFDENNEWNDGILATTYRNFANMSPSEYKWLVFDSPVDPEWIENLNTVLDENRKLCLMSGEIIKLPQNTNLIFETQDCSTATPATISRCGMLYLAGDPLTWQILVTTWVKTLPEAINKGLRDMIKTLFLRFLPPMLQLLSNFPTHCVKSTDKNILKGFINIFDCHLSIFDETWSKGKSEHELRPVLEGIFFYSCIWAVGGLCDSFLSKRFNEVFTELMEGDLRKETKANNNITVEVPTMKTAYALPIPKQRSVFSYQLVIHNKAEWTKWEDVLSTNTQLPRDVYAGNMIIPTLDTVRYQHIMGLLVKNDKPFILIGPSGTGKTVYIKDLLNRKLDKEKFSSTAVYFTKISTPNVTQDIIMSKLDKRRKGVYGPALGKSFIIFVDDINLPEKDCVGSQGTIELLRQMMDHKTWYDNKELFSMKIVNTSVIAAIKPPACDNERMSERFMRHFNSIYIDHFEDSTITAIFSRIVLWHLDTKGFSKEFDPCIEQVVSSTLELHKYAVKNLLPTPNRTHYLFNLRDFSRVILGVLLSAPESMEDLKAMKRLWIHEAMRVYYDRLVDDVDKSNLFKVVRKTVQSKMKEDFNDLLQVLSTDGSTVTENDMRSMNYSDFMNPSEDEKFYRENTDMEKMRETVAGYLEEYNKTSRKPMDLVLFNFALEHLCRINRILKQPQSHALLVGVCGSGRQCLTRLAAHISNYNFQMIEMSNSYSFKDWRNDLKNVLRKFSTEITSCVLYVYDNQLKNELFLEDINNILNLGEVPNIFTADEKNEVVENMRTLESQLDKSLHTEGGSQELFDLFIRMVREKLHIVIGMSTYSPNFNSSLRNFPCILNCCTVDWFTLWPPDALHFVSHSFLKDIKFTPEELEGCTKVSEFFHTSATVMADEAYDGETLFNCVTPATFLELNKLFRTLLESKRNEVDDIKQRYTVGLDKIKDAASQVSVMQAELEAIQPHLTAASKEVDKSVALVEKDLNEVSELEKIVKNEDSVVSEKTKQADALRQELQDDLAEVTAVVDAAIETLNSLTAQDFAAVRAVKTPPNSIKLIMEAICMLKNIKPDKIPDPNGKTVDDYWGPAKRIMGEPKFVAELTEFEKDDINMKTMKLIRDRYLSNAEIDPETSKQSMGAGDAVAKCLFRWLVSIEAYDKIAKQVAPKKEALQKLDVELETDSKSLKEKQEVYDEANGKLKVLQADLATKKAKKAELENEVETCSRKLERAEQLIGGLGGERDKWATIVGNLGTRFVKLTGDVLLSSALVAYLGAFTFEEREKKVAEWMEKCKEHNVPFSEDFSLYNVLGDPITTQAWQLCGLPTDQFSTNNGIITFTSRRWVCFMDPQEIGKKWIHSIEKNNNLQILRQSDPEFLRSLESSIQFGQPALLENVGETLDPILEPLLTKQTFKQGGSVCLKLGDSTLEYHKDFKLYITTKLKVPRFARDTVSKVALINFSITTMGLDEQLLTITVTRERPELEEERAQLTVQANDNRKQLRDIENKILEVLYSSKGNILEDENAIKVLSSSKVLANEITEKQNVAFESRKKIDDNRAPYLEVASYAGVLFFTICELSTVNHMYQYSLNWFINLFCNSIDLAEKSEEMAERLSNINDHVTWTLYQTVCRGLFEEDRFLFSLLLCVHLMKYQNKLTQEEFIAFLSLPNDNEDYGENPLKHFGNDAFRKLSHLGRTFKEMENILAVVKENEGVWLELIESNPATILEVDFPNFPNISKFKKLIILKCLAAIHLKEIVPFFVGENIGEKYTVSPLPDMTKTYNESSSTTPIAFIIGQTADPCEEIYELAEKMNLGAKRLQFLCLGKGKENQAAELLKDGVQAGTWVILENCHLVPEWLPILESICESFDEETASPDFRLFMTSVTTTKFPVPVLQTCIKVVLEEPLNVKENLLRTQLLPKSEVTKYNENGDLYKKMLFTYSMFHAVLNERVHFTEVGWNQDYVFSRKNLKLCLSYLFETLKENESLNLKATSYLTSECIYGSGMEDYLDSRTLLTIFQKFCCKELLNEDEQCFDESKVYKIKPFKSFDELIESINQLPPQTRRGLLGMPQAISDFRKRKDTNKLLTNLMLTQNLSLHTKVLTENSQILDRVEKIIESIPKLFNVDKIVDKFSSMNIILGQELTSCNKLIDIVTGSLRSLREALVGMNVMSSEAENTFRHVKKNLVLDEFKVCIKDLVFITKKSFTFVFNLESNISNNLQSTRFHGRFEGKSDVPSKLARQRISTKDKIVSHYVS